MRKKSKQGFTLIEIMVVVAIILLLAGMLFRIGNLISDRSKRAKAIADMNQIANALEEYYGAFQFYPPTSGMKYIYADNSMRPDPIQGNPFPDDHSDGLCAYLYGRGGMDPLEDIPGELIKRMSVYVGGMDSSPAQYATNSIPGEGDFIYSNATRTISGPYGEYGYQTRPPYLSYELYTDVPGGERLSISSGGH